MTMDELRTEMVEGFAEVRERLDKADERFAKIDKQFAELRAEIKAEGETTRRHFDIVAERMTDSVKIVAEVSAHHAVRLDDHERRIRRLE